MLASLAIVEEWNPIDELDPNARDIHTGVEAGVEDTKNRQQTRGVSDSVSQRQIRNRRKWLLDNVLTLKRGILGAILAVGVLSLRQRDSVDWLWPLVSVSIHMIPVLLSMAVDLLSGIYNLRTSQRKSIKQHLQNRGISWPIFYGLDIFVIYILATGFLSTVVRKFACFSGINNDNNPVPFSLSLLADLLIGLGLNNLHLAWIHSVTSKPNKSKSLRQRIPSLQSWIKTAPAASLDIVLPSLINYLAGRIMPSYLFAYSVAFPILFVPGLLVSVITEAIYIRVAMTTLPEDAEPILCSNGFRSRLSKDDGGYSLNVLHAFQGIESQNWYRYLKVMGEVMLHEELQLGLFLLAIIVLDHSTFASLLAYFAEWLESHGIA